MGRLRRSESFLGVHFDFHAREDCTEVGKQVTAEMIERIIEMVKPDYLQCDCKGHPGFSSYPTAVGNPVPGFEKDQLAIWREVTAEHDVALYMHYSGVIDREVARQRPDWAAVTADGKPDVQNTSLYGPYVDKLLIPQLKELRDEYGVDGMWIDGECWAVKPEYGHEALRRYQAATGRRDVPRAPDEPGYRELLEEVRRAFREYVAHYVEALHRHDPEFQIASNWAFSSQMPEPVSIDVDYLSGDYSPENSVNSARFEGRCLQHQSEAWDLMAWSFTSRAKEPDRSTKSPVQLKQEASVVLALGGGFQAYFKQKRDGSIYPWTMKLMAEVAEFCHDRRRLCHRASPIPQVALVYAGKSFYHESTKAFGNWANETLAPLTGVLQNLLDSQNVVEICMEHHLSGRMADYPLIVVPEWRYLEPRFRHELVEYVEAGGSLLLIGPECARHFEAELDVSFQGDVEGSSTIYVEHEGWMSAFAGRHERVRPAERAEAFGRWYHGNDFETPDEQTETADGFLQASTVYATYGKGTLAAIPFEMGSAYLRGATAVARDFLKSVVDRLFPDPLVTVSGSHSVDVTLMRKDTSDGELTLVNLVNTAGPHGDPSVYVYDEVPPIGPLTITLKHPHVPQSVTFEPGGTELDFVYQDGAVVTTVESLDIHRILAVR